MHMKRSPKVNRKQIFYEKVYPQGKGAVVAEGLLGFLFTKLRRFEVYREDIVYHLLPKGKTFLDIGCGDGSLVFRAVDKFDMCIGADIARTRLADAGKWWKKMKGKSNRKISFLVADADEELPFEKESFDTVTMVATLEHFFDPYHVMGEVKKVMKSHGTLIVQVPNVCFFPRRLSFLLGILPSTSEDTHGWDGGHLHYFTVDSLEEFLERFGFRIDTVTCSGIFAPLRSLWVSFLGPDIIIKAKKM